MNELPEWQHYRVIHSRFPPVNLFDESEPQNRLLAELEGVTSDRLVRWREFIRLPDDARFGNGWGPVMASFCYVREGRFNTPDFGAYYCADSPRVAIAEWSHHATMVWRDHGFSDEASATVRCYTGNFSEPMVDVRSNKKAHQKDSYVYSQELGQRHRNADEFGVIYRSVRCVDGQAVALFRPPGTSPVRQAAHYSIQWDGNKFVQFATIGEYEKI